MWDALQSMGFSGGKVFDPCAGTSVFGAVSPESAVMDAVEMDETSAPPSTATPFEAGMKYEAAQAARQYFIAVARTNELLTWANGMLLSVGRLPENKREGQYTALPPMM